MSTSEHDVELATVLALLADSLRDGQDVVDTMDTLVQASTRFTSANDAGILLADATGVLHVVASSNERTTDVEEAQLGSDEGPCLECYHSGEPVEVSDLAREGWRWPHFVTIAESRGFRAAHASPLRLRGQTFGAMNLFSEQPGLFSDYDAALAVALAHVATISLVQQRTNRDHAATNDQLQRALGTRILIEQAKGILAQRHGLSVDAAFSRLRNHARTNRARLHDIADGVINQGLIV
ncbi:GAF and ANTAR domain-containing protein [Glaciihabitans sp. dw_435]|uniref:GAF and ANTAR domain-containing protein n=1 Tax=Glaciihabitans sp. dw_435 TaxID=2720081 RepID=UPI001BD2CD77|nr:GAF and ANTAR domain-containing protein [Glaciihabitans sp. dw_435]